MVKSPQHRASHSEGADELPVRVVLFLAACGLLGHAGEVGEPRAALVPRAGILNHEARIANNHALGVMALAVAGIVVALAPAALAHVPALESSEGEGAAAIGGPEVSRAIYGYLAPDETSDSYVFSVDEPVTQVIGILVPVRGDHEGFRPVLRMLADDTDLTVIEDPGLSERATEWEPFSLTSFWLGGEEQVSFEPGVGYELRVEPGDGPADSGRYVIVFGGPEAFTGADALRTLGYLPVIWFGAYGGAPAHWNWWALIPVAVVVLLIALLTTTVSRRDARART